MVRKLRSFPRVCREEIVADPYGPISRSALHSAAIQELHRSVPTEPAINETIDCTTFAGVHGTLEMMRLRSNVIYLKFTGHDIGEFGAGPFNELETDLERGVPIEIFIDARETQCVSMEVSGAWAHWMMAHRAQIYRLNILCSSNFVQMTAGFVQRFTEFGDQMRIFQEPAGFDLALQVATMR